jgi:hypothetical protein
MFIQNIHLRDEYVRTSEAPTVVFDEAQRAWDKEHASRFMREKRGRIEFDMSEPHFLISVVLGRAAGQINHNMDRLVSG